MDERFGLRRAGRVADALVRIGSRIRDLRKERGLSQEAVAELSGLSRAYFGRIERGDADLSVTSLLKIARALNVPAAFLLEKAPE